MTRSRPRRFTVGLTAGSARGLERDLEQAMRPAGYDVINEVKSRKETDGKLWKKVHREFD